MPRCKLKKERTLSMLKENYKITEALDSLYEANRIGIWFWLQDNALKFKSPEDTDISELISRVKEVKEEIISLLTFNKIFSNKPISNFIYQLPVTETPLSFAQERLWFIEQFEEGTNAYHIPLTYKLKDKADKSAIICSIQQIIARHEILRTTIVQSSSGGMQRVHAMPLKIDEFYLSKDENLNDSIKTYVNRPFDLQTEYPIRVGFYDELTPSHHKTYLVILVHHIVTDGWSMEIFNKELKLYYQNYVKGNVSFSFPPLPIQYKDYASWQKKYLTDLILSGHISYWKDKLSGYTPLDFPTDYIRPARADYKGLLHAFELDKLLSSKLRILARSQGVSLNSVLLSGTYILLSKYTNQEDIVIGSDSANRNHYQIQNLIGFFVTMQVNRVVLNSGENFIDLLKRVHQDQMEAQLYQDLPFEKLIEVLDVQRDPSRHPIFQINFGVQSFGNIPLEDDCLLRFDIPSIYEVEKFDLSIIVTDDGSSCLRVHLNYATSLFSESSIRLLANRFTYLLSQLVASPTVPYKSCNLMDSAELLQLAKWNSTDRVYPSDQTLHALFESQALKTPDRIALACNDLELSYSELNERSNQLAYHIRALYVDQNNKILPPDTLIAICMDRSIEIVIGILAILKAGGAYVPIDPRYPQERIDYILSDTGTPMVLTDRRLKNVEIPQEKVVYIDLTESIYNSTQKSNLVNQNTVKDLSYVIYTSGSTGKPKGAMIEHAGMVNHLYSKINLLKLNGNSVVAQNASQSFDISVWQFFSALLCGGKTILYTNEMILSPQAFIHRLFQDQTTVLEVVPSYLSVMLDVLQKEGEMDLRLLKDLLVTGEELKADLVKRWFELYPSKRLINAYGPTEASDDIAHHVMNNYDGSALIPIGKPIENFKIYIVNKDMQQCPVGIWGEICVSGVGVGRGYLNNLQKTKDVFIQDPFRKQDRVRLYKTGDIGRWLPDGTLQYKGRKDDQVKINGYRIELGEIAYTLTELVGIKEAVVIVKERKTEHKQSTLLAAYYILEDNFKLLSQESIIGQLSSKLPEYMIPKAFIEMEFFPLTSNGKLDKNALPDPQFDSLVELYVAPVSETEIELCRIWQDVLGLERVGVMDNFFQIGGNSIMAIQVSHRINKTLGWQIKVADLFMYPTCAQLIVYSNKKSIAYVEGEL